MEMKALLAILDLIEVAHDIYNGRLAASTADGSIDPRGLKRLQKKYEQAVNSPSPAYDQDCA